MHTEILNSRQMDLLSLISYFQEFFVLVGGTSIALYLGHRESIDFDLFSEHPIRHNNILGAIRNFGYSIDRTLVNNGDELTVIVNAVKLTFLEFPFHFIRNTNTILPGTRSPDLLTIASLKAYAMGRRGKWKDYVDMYFLLRQHISISDISDRAQEIF